MRRVNEWFVRLQIGRGGGSRRDERGDIPGWVMITVMTIGFASLIFGLFRNAVTEFLNNALGQYM